MKNETGNESPAQAYFPVHTRLLSSEQYTGIRSCLSGHFVGREHTELRSCVKVEVAVLGFPS